MTTVIAFDVNETLLDLRALDPQFELLFGSAAMRAQAAFVARPGMVLSPLGAAPDIVGSDLTEVAELIIERDLD
jgi:hypothetical protein